MKTLKPTLDSRTFDTRKFDNVPLGNENDLPEYEKPVQKCFAGAWYRKVVSPVGDWIGIEGEIELGEFIPDPKRFNLDGKGRNMDNPNLYMGGKAELESDCGIGYNLTYPSTDTSYELGLDAPKLGYRPFWRYIYKTRETENGCTLVKNINSWNAADPKNFSYYYFPGDVIRMKVYSPIPNYLQLRIEVVKTTTNPKYIEIRKRYNLPNDCPQDFYSPLFLSEGHGLGQAEFKRVNSIDQYGNEGYAAKDTDAVMTTATWNNCYLYREVNGQVVKYPFTENIYCSLICPNELAVSVEEHNKNVGGEKVTIHPGKCRK